MSRYKRRIFFMMALLIFCLGTSAKGIVQEAKADEIISFNASDKGQVAKVDNFTFKTKEQIPSTISLNIDFDYDRVSYINEFWGNDGNYHVVYSGKNKVYISVINQDMKLKKTIEINKDLPLLGNAIQDQDGNYYMVYGKYDTANLETDSKVGTAVVMSIVKYDKDGKQLERLTFKGNETCPYEGTEWGTKEPFNFGRCNLLIDSKGILVCRYGRVMYNGHQSSHTLYVNTKTMTKLQYLSPYTSHSFDQRVIETSDGGYLFAERGDAYDRGFVVSKWYPYITRIWDIPNFVPFHFRNGYIYQTTYAILAGIAECSNGYALAGISEKTLSYETDQTKVHPEFNESRNLFLQVFSKQFNSGSSNQSSVQLLKGESRVAKGQYVSGTGRLENGAVDYGVLWLTNYTGSIYASNPKMLNIGNDQLLLMWEKKDYNKGWNQYIESCYMIVSSDGRIIKPETRIQDIHLTEFGEPTYRDGQVYWTTSDGESMNFVVHRLTVGETMPEKIHVNSIELKQSYMIANAGEKTAINAKVLPANADNPGLLYEVFDEDIISVDKKGIITVKDTGTTYVYIVSEENEEIWEEIKIITINSAPTKLKVVQEEAYFSDYKVKLTWNASKIDSSYEVYRSTKKNSGYTYLDTVYDTYYYDDTVKAGKKYYYKVKASNYEWDDDLKQNPFSSPVMIYITGKPQNMKLTKSSKTSITVKWSKVKSADGYEIYYYNVTEKKYKLLKTIKDVNTVSYKKTKLTSGKSYTFKVRAYKTVDGKKYYSLFTKPLKLKL